MARAASVDAEERDELMLWPAAFGPAQYILSMADIPNKPDSARQVKSSLLQTFLRPF